MAPLCHLQVRNDVAAGAQHGLCELRDFRGPHPSQPVQRLWLGGFVGVGGRDEGFPRQQGRAASRGLGQCGLQGAGVRDRQEFIGVQQEHGVGLHHGLNLSQRSGHDLGLIVAVVRAVDHNDVAQFAAQQLQDLPRPVGGPVVQNEHQVHQPRMVPDERLDDVALVPDHRN
jgi:hypothetical protein